MGKKEETGSSSCGSPRSSSVSDKGNPNRGEETINSVHHPSDSSEMGHNQFPSSVPESNDFAAHRAGDSDNDIDAAAAVGGDGGGGAGGPKQNDSGANEEVERSTSRAAGCADVGIGLRIGVGAAAAARTTLQPPFDISVTNSAAFKSPGGGMAAPATATAILGFPFTQAQWEELERQAMIYKYMMASVPVPSDLLFPVIPARNCPAADPSFPWNGSGAYLRYGNTNSRDLEPGRCKRTDGKKWRCSRDVAPHQKYCERHMHRGRPRSRKHVEVQNSTVENNNTAAASASAAPTVTVTATNNNKKPRPQANPATANYSPSPQFLGTGTGVCRDHKPKEARFLDQQGVLPPSNSLKQPNRVFGWQMGGENAVEQQWLHLMDSRRGMGASEHDSIVFDTVLQQGGYVGEEQPLNLFSYGSDFGSGNFHSHSGHYPSHVLLNNSEQQRNPTRGFIDAWSNGEMKAMEDESTMPCSKQNLWPSDDALTLSMALDAAGMGLATPALNSEHKTAKCYPVSWQPFHSGGPLAEVLGPSSSIPIGSNPASPYTGNGDSISPPATSVSSPTGILHRALFSQSDSSVGNSPTLGASNATPDLIAFQWLN